MTNYLKSALTILKSKILKLQKIKEVPKIHSCKYLIIFDL